MRALTVPLTDAMASHSAVPHLEVKVYDFEASVPRLHWTKWYTGFEVDGPPACAVAGDGALLRARIDLSTTPDSLVHSRVASPTSGSSYAFWTGLGNVYGPGGIGMAANDTKAIIASVRTDTVTVEVRDSSDSGATYAASAVVAVAAGAVTACGVAMLDSSGSAAVFFAQGGTLYACKRTGIGAWSAAAAWGPALGSINCVSASASNDYNVFVSGTDSLGRPGCWTTRWGMGADVALGTWLALKEVILGSAGLNISYLATGNAADAGGPRLSLVEMYTGGGAYVRIHTVRGLGLTTWTDSRWVDPRAFPYQTAYGLALAGGGNEVYLVAANGIWHATWTAQPLDLTADVLSAEWTLAQDSPGRLRLVVNNEGNRYPDGAPQPAPEPGAEIRLSPGFITSDGIEVSAGPAFWIDRVSRRVADGMSVLIIEAVDSIQLLSRWRAPRQLQWTGKFTDVIGDEILRRAGLERFGGWSPIAFALVHNFTIRAGESGLVAFKRLLETVNDRMRSKSYSVELFDPDPADAVNYSYSEGAASHPRFSLQLGAERAGLGWARVFGSGIVSQAVDWYALIEGGETAVIVDDSLTVQADADARALNAIRRAEVERWRGELVVVMNAAQDPGDVISVSDATLGLGDATYRVARLRGRFATGLGARRGGGIRGAAAYELAMTLEGV